MASEVGFARFIDRDLVGLGEAGNNAVNALAADSAGQNSVDADAVGSDLARKRGGQSEHRSFRGCVGGAVRVTDLGRDGCHVDDHTAAFRTHQTDHFAAGDESGRRVDCEDEIPVLGPEFCHRCRRTSDTAIVDEQVDRAGLGDQGDDLVLICEVARDKCRTYLRSKLLATGGIDVGDDDVVAICFRAAGDGSADAAGCRRDEYTLLHGFLLCTKFQSHRSDRLRVAKSLTVDCSCLLWEPPILRLLVSSRPGGADLPTLCRSSLIPPGYCRNATSTHSAGPESGYETLARPAGSRKYGAALRG